MRNKKIVFISILLFMVVLSIGAISAEDVDDAIASSGNEPVLGDSNTVSGGVDVVTENPWNTSGELSYEIPSDATTIKSADVYVNVYSGSASNSYGANANITIATESNTTKYFESLWIGEGSTDGTVYIVNDHTTKCYSDYMIHYDITSMVDGLSGTNLAINVDTFEMDGKQFDGKIKLIALILGYDDGDYDSISYWINDDQLWTKQNVTVTFDTEDVGLFTEATLTNIVLSSGDGSYKINDDFLDDADTHVSGDYYQYNQWDVTSVVKSNQKNDLHVFNAGTSSWGSIKNVLSVLTVNNFVTGITITPEYTSVPSAYAGTNNTLTVKVNTKKAGNYAIKLLADDVEVNGTEIALAEGENTILLTDPTIRDIDETTVNGAENNMVKYTVAVSYDGTFLNSKDVSLPVLYNGNLGYDMEYGMDGYLNSVQYITGDVVIDVKDASSYLGSTAMTRTDVWAVDLNEDSEIVSGLLLIPYNWFNAKTYNESEDMFDLTFNGETIESFDFYRDQGNLGNYGKYGYGVLIYDVTDLLNASGDNTLVLNKKYATPAVYPSVLFYAYNTPGGNFKEVHFISGADLLSNSNNVAGRPVRSDIKDIIIDGEDYESVMLYVLAAGAQAGEGNIIVNGNEFVNVWNGTSSTTDLFTTDVTNIISDFTNISFVATGSTILALPQFIVGDVGYSFSVDSIKPEYTSVPSAYAGTNNTLTVTVSTDIAGEFEANLWADDELVDTIMVNLTEGTNTIVLTDPTIRPINQNTVNGADNDKVTYLVDLTNDDFIVNKNITLPILYNGNLGYDMEYNVTGFEEFDPITVTGGVVIDIHGADSYLGSSSMNRTDNWSIYLDSNSKITNAYIYVPYNWFNAKTYTEDINMFNAAFNGATVTPIAFYRDQGNLGNYGKYGYGVLIYDVSDLILIGDNSFTLNKVYPTPAVYPSALIYMFNTTDSKITKTVNILNGADLLSNGNNNAGRTVKADTEINANTNKILDATLYVMAASAQDGESNIVFNGNVYNNVWSGTSSTTDLFSIDVTDLIENSNSISFVATGSTILELSQIIITSNDNSINTSLSAPEVTTVYGSDDEFVATLSDENGNNISGADVNLVLVSGDSTVVNTTLVTDSNGKIRFAVGDLKPATYYATVNYDGKGLYNPAVIENVEVNVKKIASILTAPDVVTTYNSGDDLVVTLSDADGNPISRVKVYITVDGVQTALSTDANGQVKLSTDGLTNGDYTANILFKGTAYYSSSKTTANIIVTKVGTELVASDLTTYYNSGDDLVVTLSDADGNPISKVKVYITIDGVQTALSTDANGQVKLSTDGLAIGNYPANILFKGTAKYSSSKTTANVVVTKIGTELVAPNLTTYYNSGEEFVVNLKDVDGNPISKVKVYITVDGVQTALSTDANGQVKLSTKGLDAGNYTAKILFKGTAIYNSTKTTANINIQSKVLTELVAPDLTTVYNSGDDLVVTLKDVNGNPISKVKVYITINGVQTASSTDANGQVKLSTAGLDVGTYTATILFKGTAKYNSAKTTANICVNKISTTLNASDLTTAYGSGEKLVATLKDMNGNPISKVKVYITINGVQTALSANANGQVKLSTDGLDVGNYTAKILFKGTAYYNSTKTTANVVIIG